MPKKKKKKPPQPKDRTPAVPRWKDNPATLAMKWLQGREKDTGVFRSRLVGSAHSRREVELSLRALYGLSQGMAETVVSIFTGV